MTNNTVPQEKKDAQKMLHASLKQFQKPILIMTCQHSSDISKMQ